MMASVRHCVFIIVLSSCISSSVVDSHRVRNARRHVSGTSKRSSNNRYYPLEKYKTSRFDDCVDCRDSYEIDRDDDDVAPPRNRRPKYNLPRSKKKGDKSHSEKESSYSVWNIFKPSFWSDDDDDDDDDSSSQEQADDVPRRRSRFRGGRKHSKYRERITQNRNFRGRKWNSNSNSRYYAQSRRRPPGPSRDKLDRFQGARKARKRHGGFLSASGRDDFPSGSGRDTVPYRQSIARRYKNRKVKTGRHYDETGSQNRKGRRGRYNRLERYNRLGDDSQKGSRRISHGRTKLAKNAIDKTSYRAKERSRRRGKSRRPDMFLMDKNENSKNRRRDREKNELRRKNLNRRVYSKKHKSRKSHRFRPKTHGSNNRKPPSKSKSQIKKGRNGKDQHGEADLYPLVRTELHKINEVEVNRKRRKDRRKWKSKGNERKESLDKGNTETKVISSHDNLGKNSNEEKATAVRMSDKATKNGLKKSKQRNNKRKKKKKTKVGQKSMGVNGKPLQVKTGKGTKDADEQNTHDLEETSTKKKNILKDRRKSRKDDGTEEEMEEKKKKKKIVGRISAKNHSKGRPVLTKRVKEKKDGGRNGLSKGKKESDNENHSLEKVEKRMNKKKGKTTKGRAQIDVITKDPSRNKSKTDKSEKLSLGQGQLDASVPRKKSKLGKNIGKSKSRKKLGGRTSSTINKAFQVFANVQNMDEDKTKADKPMSKWEAEKQVEALTDEQLRYAVKIAEKRFKRTDRRIKRKLSALKEMTIQHLQALESLQMSLDHTSFLENFYDSSLSLRPPSKKISLFHNRNETLPSKSDLDFKSRAKNFLQFASKTPQKMKTSKYVVEENDVNQDMSTPLDRETARPIKVVTPISKKMNSNTQEGNDADDGQSSKGLPKISTKKFGRRRKKTKGKMKVFSSNEEGDRKKSPLANTFRSKTVKKIGRDRKRQRLDAQRGTSKTATRKEEKLEIDKSGRVTATATKTNKGQFYSDFTSKSQPGKTHGGMHMKNYRNERYKYVRDRAKYRKVQRVLPRLNRNIREIRQQLYHMLTPFTYNMKLTDTYYETVYNTTRYDILQGAREILQAINEANDDVYDAVIGASKLARSIYIKAYKRRAARRPTMPNEEAVYERALESKVKRRNFRPHLERIRQQQERLSVNKNNFHMTEMKSRQLNSRFVQVRERFLEKYDHLAFRHLFDNMRSTINILNNGLRKSFALKRLHESKTYVKNLRGEMNAARDVLKNSTNIYRIGMLKYRENEELVWLVKKEKRDLRRKRMVQADSPGPGLTSRQYRRLDRLTRKARQHAQHLSTEMYELQSVLELAMRNAKMALENFKRSSGKTNPLEIVLLRLRSGQQDAISSLDELRKFIGSTSEITLARSKLKGCERGGEGSGNLENDDEDFGCAVEGSGHEGSGDMTFVDEEDDFIFDREQEMLSPSKENPLQALGTDLKTFTNQLVRKSEDFDKRTLSVREPLKDLKEQWKDVAGNVAAVEEKVNAKRIIVDGLSAVTANSTKIGEKLKQINQKISKLEDIDFDGLNAKAEAAIESARKKMGGDGNADETKDGTETGYFGVTELLEKGKSIIKHRDVITKLQTFAVDTIEKSTDRLSFLRGNITKLWQKVKIAKNMLNSMQLSILKEGSSPIKSTALSDDLKPSKSVMTSLSLCIKPQTLDGTVLYSTGNDSISYALRLSDGELKAAVYDEDDMELADVTLNEKLTEDQWHTISFLRVGHTLNLTAAREDKVISESAEVENLPDHQLPPSLSYIGGVPERAKISDTESWEGCVSELLVDGKVMSLFNPTLNATSSTLCKDHCVSQMKKFSWIFNGYGFVHYAWEPSENVEALTFQFRSKQSNAAILSVAHKHTKFHLLVTLHNGAVQIESSTRMESLLLLSLNDSFSDGKSHTVKIFYRDRGTYPEIDGNGAAFSVENTSPRVLRNIKDGILLGAFLSEESFLANLHPPLIGCASILSVNGKPLLYDAMLQSHNVYYGQCSMRGAWQSCVHFPTDSKPLSLGEVKNSNKISLLVLRNSTGPLLLYIKENQYEIELSLTEDGLDVSSEDSEAMLLRHENYNKNEILDLVTIEDNGDEVVVSAFAESTKFSYGSWYSTNDLSVPHIIEMGQTRDGEERALTLSISELMIGGRLYDLTKLDSAQTLQPCEIPESYLKRNFPTTAASSVSNL